MTKNVDSGIIYMSSCDHKISLFVKAILPHYDFSLVTTFP